MLLHNKLYFLFVFLGSAWFGTFVLGDPTIPEPISNPAWIDKHEYFCERSRNNSDMPILFLGDSHTEYWGSYGKQVWETVYLPLNAFRYGIQGDRSENLLWRLENGELEGIEPKVIVLMIGGNNVAALDTAESIAQGIQTNLETIQRKCSNSNVLVLGVLPALNALGFQLLANINTKVVELGLDNGENVRFLNMFEHFYETWGVPNPDLYANDLVHLGRQGYQLWADLMDPLFQELLNSNQ